MLHLGRRACARIALVATGLLIASLATAPPAGAASWRGPRLLAASPILASGGLVTARNGSSLVMWSEYYEGDPDPRLILRRIAPDGQLGPRRTPLDPHPAGYDIAVDDDGDAVLVWSESVNPPVQRQVMARRISRNGALGPIVRVSRPDETSWSPHVVMSPRGVATIVYGIPAPADRPGIAMRRMRLDSSLGPRTFFASDDHTRPVASRSGHVAFVRVGDGSARAVRVDPDGTIHKRLISNDHRVGRVALDIDRRGNTYILMGARDRSRAWARVWRRGGGLSPTRRITPAGQDADFVAMATDLDGDTVLAWAILTEDSQAFRLRLRWWRRGRLGSVQKLGLMSTVEMMRAQYPDWAIDVDDDGDGVISWTAPSRDAEQSVIRTRVLTRAGSLGRPRDLGRGGSPMLAVGPGGTVRLTATSEPHEEHELTLWTRR